jgi:hypothetical protein
VYFSSLTSVGVDFAYRLREYLLQSLFLIRLIRVHGELWVLAERNGWGTDKRNAVALMLDNMVTIDINDRTVIDSYVEMARASQRLPGGARVL